MAMQQQCKHFSYDAFVCHSIELNSQKLNLIIHHSPSEFRKTISCAARLSISKLAVVTMRSESNDWPSCAACDDEDDTKEQPMQMHASSTVELQEFVLVFKLCRFRHNLSQHQSK